MYIFSVQAFSLCTPIAKAWATPSHAFPDWQECTGAYGIKLMLFWRFSSARMPTWQWNLLYSKFTQRREHSRSGRQNRSKYSFRSMHRLSASTTIHSCQPGKAWLGVNHTFAKGANKLNTLTESMYIVTPLLSLPTLSTVNWTCFSPLLVFRASPNWIQYA